MKLKKLQWINKPEKVRITSSSSLTCDVDGCSALVYTFAEDERHDITIKADDGVSAGLAIILSSEHGVSLMREKGLLVKRISFPSFKDETRLALTDDECFSFSKEGDTVTFFCGNAPVSAFTLPSIRESVSVAILLRGKGNATVSF
ncbi:MAG: hypothetical protein ACI4NM_06685 [Bullifex sp.]